MTNELNIPGVSPNAQAIKLYKYAVAFQMANDSTDSLHSEPSFVHYAVMDFVELFSAHATYKFLICDRSDESIHGLVSLHHICRKSEIFLILGVGCMTTLTVV